MPFPECVRAIYAKNPLETVICQLRFPPILRIDAELPAQFQDDVRSDYPGFSESAGIRVEPPVQAREQLPASVIARLTGSAGNKNYEFISDDEDWKINLTRNFLALSTKRYTRWEEFRERLQLPLQALRSAYSPVHCTRVGLRYVDLIQRSKLGLVGVGWEELLQPHIAGLMRDPAIAASIRDMESRSDVQLGDQHSMVRIMTKWRECPPNEEVCFVIDSDFYNQEINQFDEVIDRLDFLNSRASRLIRWSITPRLHEAMEPEDI